MADNQTDREDRPTILLVEDDPDHAELVMHCLRHHEIPNNIYHVSDGEEALDYLFQRNKYENPVKAPRPDLVLLDLRLPRIDGMEVLEEIKRSPDLKTIPVVVLTTSEREKDVDTAYDCHVNSYLVKPAGFKNLNKLIDDAAFYWLRYNRQPQVDLHQHAKGANNHTSSHLNLS